MNKCPNCGETSRIREKDKFCHKCGCNLKTGVLPERKEEKSIESFVFEQLELLSKKSKTADISQLYEISAAIEKLCKCLYLP